MSLLAGTPGDYIEEAAIERRRQIERERLMRIKDPRQWKVGVDTDALAAQIAAKQKAAALEKQRDLAYDNERLLMDQQIAYLEQERQRVEREKLKALDAQRDATQKRTMAREYDLNDPLAKLNDLPGRVGDDDPRLSVSGMQMFHGEDLGYAARKQLQAEDQRAWNMEMAGMKAEAAAKAKAEAAEFAARGMEIDAIKQGLEAATIAQKKAVAKAVAEYQLSQFDAKRERERGEQVQSLQDSVEEIQQALAVSSRRPFPARRHPAPNARVPRGSLARAPPRVALVSLTRPRLPRPPQSDSLTENPAVGRSFIAPHRVRPDHYKGMAPEQQQAIYQEVAEQQAMKKAADAAAAAQSAEVDAQLDYLRRLGNATEAEIAFKRAEARKAVAAENAELAREQLATKSFLTSQVFTNEVGPEYFDKFNTTAR